MRAIGKLDNPQAYGCPRSVSVYEGPRGYFFLLDGRRKKVRGNQRWTSLHGAHMRGSRCIQHELLTHEQADSGDDSVAAGISAIEEDEINVAIAASLLDVPNDSVQADPPPPEEPPVALPSCTICLSEIQVGQGRFLPCAHAFHERCIAQWLRRSNTCPECRRRV